LVNPFPSGADYRSVPHFAAPGAARLPFVLHAREISRALSSNFGNTHASCAATIDSRASLPHRAERRRTGAGRTVTINRQTLRVSPGAGKEGNGPKLDLKPGTYKAIVKVPGKAAVSEDVKIVAGQTMGLLIGPGGILPLQVY